MWKAWIQIKTLPEWPEGSWAQGLIAINMSSAGGRRCLSIHGPGEKQSHIFHLTLIEVQVPIGDCLVRMKWTSATQSL